MENGFHQTCRFVKVRTLWMKYSKMHIQKKIGFFSRIFHGVCFTWPTIAIQKEVRNINKLHLFLSFLSLSHLFITARNCIKLSNFIRVLHLAPTVKVCLRPIPADKNLRIDSVGETFNNGTSINYSCPRGYNVRGSMVSTCLNGELDPPDLPFCEGMGSRYETLKDMSANEFIYQGVPLFVNCHWLIDQKISTKGTSFILIHPFLHTFTYVFISHNLPWTREAISETREV